MRIFESTSIPIWKEMKVLSNLCFISPPFLQKHFTTWNPICWRCFTYISWNVCPDHTNTLFTHLFTCNNQTALLRSTRLPLVWIFQSFQLSMYNQEKILRCIWCADDRRDLLILLCNLQRNHNLASRWYKGQRGSVALFLLEGVRTGQAEGWRKIKNTKSPRKDH